MMKVPYRPGSPVHSPNWLVLLDDDYDGGCFRFRFDHCRCPLRRIWGALPPPAISDASLQVHSQSVLDYIRNLD